MYSCFQEYIDGSEEAQGEQPVYVLARTAVRVMDVWAHYCFRVPIGKVSQDTSLQRH